MEDKLEEVYKIALENQQELKRQSEQINKNVNSINNNFEQIQKNTGAFDMLKIASDKLRNARSSNKRLFIILIIILVMWFATIGYLVYVLNDVGYIEETTQEVEQQNTNGDNNFIGNNGDISYGKAEN